MSSGCSFHDVHGVHIGGLGNWTTEGCNTTLDRESGVVVCMCNHLTNFATLVVSVD